MAPVREGTYTVCVYGSSSCETRREIRICRTIFQVHNLWRSRKIQPKSHPLSTCSHSVTWNKLVLTLHRDRCSWKIAQAKRSQYSLCESGQLSTQQADLRVELFVLTSRVICFEAERKLSPASNSTDEWCIIRTPLPPHNLAETTGLPKSRTAPKDGPSQEWVFRANSVYLCSKEQFRFQAWETDFTFFLFIYILCSPSVHLHDSRRQTGYVV